MRALWIGAALVGLAFASPAAHTRPLATYRIDHIVDGDTIALRNGRHVRLVQIDTPEVYFGTECYGPQASLAMKRLLPVGSVVRLEFEPTTDRSDQYGRLLAYVIRGRDTLNINLRLVAIGAAAPYFYEGRRGMYAVRVRSSYTGGALGTPKNRERRDVDLISDVVELLACWRDRRGTSIDDLVFSGDNDSMFLSPTVLLRRQLLSSDGQR